MPRSLARTSIQQDSKHCLHASPSQLQAPWRRSNNTPRRCLVTSSERASATLRGTLENEGKGHQPIGKETHFLPQRACGTKSKRCQSSSQGRDTPHETCNRLIHWSPSYQSRREGSDASHQPLFMRLLTEPLMTNSRTHCHAST